MNPSSLTLSPDAFNAQMVGGVITATGTPGESVADGQSRAAAIVEMFRAFDPADAMESMIACHCITLQFVLNAAMRDAGNLSLDPVVLTRMRASAMSISKTLLLWVTKYERIHARNETRAAEVRKQEVQAEATSKPEPVTRQPEPVTPKVPQTNVPPAIVPPTVPFSAPGVFVANPAPRPSNKAALLSSAAVSSGIPSNGRLTGALSPTGT
jgi:hypothetical protein